LSPPGGRQTAPPGRNPHDRPALALHPANA
jgi:hypothetical protein